MILIFVLKLKKSSEGKVVSSNLSQKPSQLSFFLGFKLQDGVGRQQRSSLRIRRIGHRQEGKERKKSQIKRFSFYFLIDFINWLLYWLLNLLLMNFIYDVLFKRLYKLTSLLTFKLAFKGLYLWRFYLSLKVTFQVTF